MKIHIVKKGDTLYELAKKYNVELDEIIALNPQIADPNAIDVGMKVKIPSKPKPMAPPVDFAYKHVVQQGDSLWKLGKAWDIPLHEMIKANPQLKNPNVLMTGEVVYIPKMGAGEAGQPSPSKPSTEPIVQQPVEQMPIAESPVPMTPSMGTAPIMPPSMPMTPSMPMQNPMMPMTPSMSMQNPMMPMTPSMSMQNPMMPMSPMQPSTMPLAPMMDHTPYQQTPDWNVTPPVAESQSQPDMEFGLSEPYTQAVHPFKSFHIKATEVIAYPESEEPVEAGALPDWAEMSHMQQAQQMPAMPQMPQMPHMQQMQQMQQMPHMQQMQQMPNMQQMPEMPDMTQAAHMQQMPWEGAEVKSTDDMLHTPWNPAGQMPWPEMPHDEAPWSGVPAEGPAGAFPFSDGGCGCGGHMTPAEPWQGQQPGMVTHYPPVVMPMGMPQSPFPPAGFPMSHDGAAYPPGMMPAYGATHQYPYQMPYYPPAQEAGAAHMPQVQTHELAEETNKEETIEIDIREDKKSGKAARSGANSTRKARSSSKSPLQNFVNKQQFRTERVEPKPNLPWINV
ncbi:LysM peptidoglycan-binding domain-containing protein [Paenibacillus hexagrammi]|uniref:LysM peptidoglycan-binding domain-containing protein n=1 Tax=Paenibacillus hexagrammi TaxID=2908839 RepID=A0ABY3SDB6_9BACL|nr:LysM peptidoglycan-binding domain-containing protein [Paenibacillus sp. YPD9-1]UJF31983.1 LysM peptidoglycan-binding domain-containing protein [Paenibacillus sp. YPD9-1]